MPQSPPTFRMHSTRTNEKQWQSRIDGRHALYNLWQWRGPNGIRKRRLAENPLCCECLKVSKLTPATEVDHIEPHGGDVEKFLDWDNTQSMCKACHSRKTMQEQRSK